nr:zinc finger, CCHC-type [Tanacetum cinerariifolium]
MVLVPTRKQSWNVRSVARLVTSKGIVVVVKRTTQMLVVQERGLRTNPKTKADAIAWWIDSGAITYVCKYRCWFKTYEPVEDGSVLYMGDDHFAFVYGNGSVVLEFSLGKSITLFKVTYVPKLHINLIYGPVSNKCGYKQVYESDKYILSKFGVFVRFGYYNNAMFMLNLNKVYDDSVSVYMSSSTVVNFLLWHARLRHVNYYLTQHSKVYRFYVIKPNDSVSINSIIKSRDAIFDENNFISIPRPKDIIPTSVESQRDDHGDDIPISRITTIRLLLALASIHNLVIRQMDVKTTFLNGDLDEEVYMKQSKGFVTPVDKTKKFLSLKFSMKDTGKADVIIGIKIKRGIKGIVITQSHYIEKILKKFNREDCSPMSTPMDPVEKLKPNTGLEGIRIRVTLWIRQLEKCCYPEAGKTGMIGEQYTSFKLGGKKWSLKVYPIIAFTVLLLYNFNTMAV